MIGCAISSSTSGGTETGPGVNRYLFVGVTLDLQGDRQTAQAKKKACRPRPRNARPRCSTRDIPGPRPLYLDNGAHIESQVSGVHGRETPAAPFELKIQATNG